MKMLAYIGAAVTFIGCCKLLYDFKCEPYQGRFKQAAITILIGITAIMLGVILK